MEINKNTKKRKHWRGIWKKTGNSRQTEVKQRTSKSVGERGRRAMLL